MGQTQTDEIRLVDTALLPGGGLLRLLECEGEFSIELENEELMGTTDHVSEEALATLAAERLESLDGRILIGGLGMGFTLGAALKAWGPDARICVAELVPEIIAWARGPLAHVFGDKLSDPRVSIALTDVHDVIAGTRDQFDAILLDVDNGPDGFVQAANDRLYGRQGLLSAHAALRPGGVLAVWSADPDDAFLALLQQLPFAVDEVRVPAFVGSTTEEHCIWFASKA